LTSKIECQCGCGYEVDSLEHIQFHYQDIMREIEQTRKAEVEIEKINDIEGHTKIHIHSSQCFCAEVW